jgi:hypothetical protein
MKGREKRKKKSRWNKNSKRRERKYVITSGRLAMIHNYHTCSWLAEHGLWYVAALFQTDV